MRVIIILLIVLGIVSAASFKVFLEPTFFHKDKQESIESQVEQESSGFSGKEPAKEQSKNAQADSDDPIISVQTRTDKKAIILTFQNLQNVTKIGYSVTYTAKGVSKGVKGTIERAGDEAFLSREIILGTCSGTVCVYDEGVASTSIVATFMFKDGVTVKVEKTHTVTSS